MSEQILCVGGRLDGQRIEFRGEHFNVVKLNEFYPDLSSSPKIQPVPSEYDQYRIDRLYSKGAVATNMAQVYLLYGLTTHDLIERLIQYYTPPTKGTIL